MFLLIFLALVEAQTPPSILVNDSNLLKLYDVSDASMMYYQNYIYKVADLLAITKNLQSVGVTSEEPLLFNLLLPGSAVVQRTFGVFQQLAKQIVTWSKSPSATAAQQKRGKDAQALLDFYNTGNPATKLMPKFYHRTTETAFPLMLQSQYVKNQQSPPGAWFSAGIWLPNLQVPHFAFQDNVGTMDNSSHTYRWYLNTSPYDDTTEIWCPSQPRDVYFGPNATLGDRAVRVGVPEGEVAKWQTKLAALFGSASKEYTFYSERMFTMPQFYLERQLLTMARIYAGDRANVMVEGSLMLQPASSSTLTYGTCMAGSALDKLGNGEILWISTQSIYAVWITARIVVVRRSTPAHGCKVISNGQCVTALAINPSIKENAYFGPDSHFHCWKGVGYNGNDTCFNHFGPSLGLGKTCNRPGYFVKDPYKTPKELLAEIVRGDVMTVPAAVAAFVPFSMPATPAPTAST